MNLIENYYLGHLPQASSLDTLEGVENFMQTVDVTALLIEVVTQDFINKTQIFSQILIQQRSADETMTLAILDKQRDSMITGLNAIVNAYGKHPNKSQMEAAHKIRLKIDAHGKQIYRLSYAQETSIVHSLVEDLQSTEVAPLIEQIHLTQWVEDMKACNDSFKQMFDQRNINNAEYIVGGTKTARDNAEESFYTLCDMINSHIKVSGEAPYVEVVNTINTIVKKAINDNKHRGSHDAQPTRKNIKH